MYKVSMHDLIAIKKALIESNKILTEFYTNPNYNGVLSISASIEENEKQIKLITETYHINE
jgi:hypothetical protein